MPRGSLPHRRELYAGVLFLDIAGFTKITETASKQGRYGVELVTGIINRHYRATNRIISASGGEIFKFGGDSCLIIFPDLGPDGLHTLRGVADSITKQSAVFDKQFRALYGVSFALHGGCCAGKICVNILGDPAHHLDYYVDGAAISRAYDLAEGQLGIKLEESCFEPQAHFPEQQAAASVRSRFSFLPAPVKAKLSGGRLAAELRNATVVFINLSSSLGEQILFDEYDRWFRQVQRFVYRYEGVVNKIDFTEKGYLMLLVFGVPVVHQDDIERAFLCATRITQIPSEHLKIRIGINYSNIYVGTIGSPARREYGIIGNAVNIAARLMSSAEPGQICISKEIIPKVQLKFELAFVAQTRVKGISEAIEVHKLVRELPEQWQQYTGQFEAKPFCLAPERLDTLKAALDAEGEALIRISGAAGTGKSYLIWHLAQHLRDRGKTFHLLSADEFTTGLRLEFFYRSLRKLLGIEKFSRQFEEVLSWCSKQGLVFDSRILHRNLVAHQPDPESKELLHCILFDILCALYPPSDCLIIDPLDNFDAESRELILALGKRNLASGSKLIISSSGALNILQESGFRQFELPLQAFEPQESTRLLDFYLPHASPAAAAELIRLTGSNPRFLCELLEHIRANYFGETDLITEADISNMQSSGLIPDRIENLILYSYQSMQPSLQQVVKLACIMGRPFRQSDLERVLAAVRPQNWDKHLQEACQTGILAVVDLLPEPVYGFSSPLLRETIYRTILRNDKVKLHNEIARFYESRLLQGESELLESVAYHYIQTGDRAKLLHWSALLADDYFRGGAYELSRNYYQLLVDNSPDEKQKNSARLRVLEIRLALADNEAARVELDALKGLLQKPGLLHDRYLSLLSRYYNNIADFPRLRSFLEAELEGVSDPEIKDLLRIDRCEAMMLQGDSAAFSHAATLLFAELRARKNYHAQNRFSAVIAQFYTNQGDYSRALKYYKLKQQLAARLKDPVGKRIGLSGMGIALSRSGKKEEALKCFRQALETAEKSGDRNGYSKALLNIGTIYRNQGNYAEALTHYQKSLVIAHHIGNLMQESIIIYDIGELLSYQNRHEEALTFFRRSLEIADKIGDDNGKSFCYDAIGDNYFHRGLYQEAKATYEENLILQLRINDREGIAHTRGNLGNIAKTEQNWDLARENYHKQLEILSEVGDQDGSGRAWFNLAMIDIEAGTPQHAKAKLEKALELFQACGAQYYIDLTREQLKSVSDADPTT